MLCVFTRPHPRPPPWSSVRQPAASRWREVEVGGALCAREELQGSVDPVVPCASGSRLLPTSVVVKLQEWQLSCLHDKRGKPRRGLAEMGIGVRAGIDGCISAPEFRGRNCVDFVEELGKKGGQFQIWRRGAHAVSRMGVGPLRCKGRVAA
jgi:hypothetical protein